MIRVGYYKYRIFVEIDHSLADATALINFLKSLLYHYFVLSGKNIDDKNEDVFKDNIHTIADYDDSFLVHTKNKRKSYKEKKIKNVYLVKGKPFKFYGDNVIHGILSLKKIKEESKKYNITITAYILSVLAYSIYETRIKNRLDGKNIVICIPVNLRKMFPSISLKNFFGVANIAFNTKEHLTFEDIVKIADKEMKEKINKEKLENFIYENTKLENHAAARFVPLFIKNFAVNLIFEFFEDKIKTMTISNFGNIILDWQKKGPKEKNIKLQSNFIQASVTGEFTFKDLINNIKYSISEYLPGLIEAPEKKMPECQINAMVHIQNLDAVKCILGTPISFGQAAYINAFYNSKKSLTQIQVNAPHIIYGTENIKNLYVNYSGSNGFLNGNLSLAREMNQKMVHIDVNTNIQDGILYNQLHWNIPKNKKYSGTIALNALFEETPEKKTRTIINFNPSEIVINDSIWHVHSAQVDIHPEKILIDNFLIDQSADRYLSIKGSVSDQDNDSLVANLKNINLQYVFNMINFHAVEFDGFATGKVYAHNLKSDPTIEAYLNVQDFTFNLAKMGNMNAYARWKKSEQSISLNAQMNDLAENSMTRVDGTVTPGHAPGSGLNLNITANNTNLYFLNQYTSGIFTNLQGRTTGNLRVFGPFGGIDIEGDMMVKHANMKVDILNTKYHMYNNMITIRPGKIIFKNAIIYDENGGTQTEGHKAVINGVLAHDHFSKMTYDLDIKTDRLLAYDQEEFGDELFCGTAIASGSVGIKGSPGILNVDINAWPEEGTLFQYNLSRPDVLTENQFVKFVSNKKENNKNNNLIFENETNNFISNKVESNQPLTTEPTENTSDVRVNFNLHITPRATLRILMDARAGDYVSVNGNGNIKASFYNKGKFQMYGTFTVQEGIYKLSLQDVIRKDFILSPGGSIVFGGDPNEAALKLQE